MTTPGPLAGATVLIADDHGPNLALLERILTSAGVEHIHRTTRAEDVAGLFRTVEPDIVLLDLHMPGQDGVTVMEHIRHASGPDQFVPVIVLTADITDHARDRVLAAGANDFLTKPIDRTEVILRVRNLLHTRALHDRLRSHNIELRDEINSVRADEEQAERDAADKHARIRHILDTGSLRTVFQPIVELATGNRVGHEALTRFDQKPHRPPDHWFRDAADVGLGTELELAAITAALKAHAASSWELLSINVSPTTATHPDLTAVLATATVNTVILEITEHAPVDDYDALAAALKPHRDNGALIAVDDAGAGYASLNHILRLHPDVIKLDTTLVRDIHTDPIKRALAASLVRFAQDTNAYIVAEGIETPDECATLIDLGIPWGQGYHLGRPGAL